MIGFSQIATTVIIIFYVNKCLNSEWWWEYMNYKQSDCPSLGLGLIKMDYYKIGQGLGSERGYCRSKDRVSWRMNWKGTT